MTNEKWLMVFVSAVLWVLNLLLLRIAMLKISNAKAVGAEIPWSWRMQVLLSAVSIGGFLAWWASVLVPPAGQVPHWILTLKAIPTGPTAMIITVIALLIATLFTVTADD